MQNDSFTTPESLAADERFQAFCANPAPTGAEEADWQSWCKASPQNERIFQEARLLVEKLWALPEPIDTASAWQSLQSELSPLAQPKVVPVQTWGRRKWTVAAAIALLFAVSAGIWQFTASPEPVFTHQQTEFGQTDSVRLQDGSIVVLNANSSLRYAENWAEAPQREIWLEGEAFFSVAHQNGKPFVVHTAEGDIEVLGTEFNVNQRPDRFAVTLMEGKVQLRRADQPVVPLRPGQQAKLKASQLAVQEIDLETVAAWRFDKMIFRNAPIRDIIQRLEHDFGWELRVSNPVLLDRQLNAEIPSNNPELLLQALSVIYDLNIIPEENNRYLIE